MTKHIKIGILALQGAFIEHATMLDRLGVQHFEIRQCKDLETDFDGLILPGGESTVMKKLLYELDLYKPIMQKIQEGVPVLGTCAGLLLLAKQIQGGDPCFASMDITARRNAYGRQLGSFFAYEKFAGTKTVPMTFIRAPYIEEVGKDVEVLASAYGKITAARQGGQLVTAFHPELSNDTTVHQYFLKMID